MINPEAQPVMRGHARFARQTRSWLRSGNIFTRSVFWQSRPDSVARAVAIALFLAFQPLPIKSIVGVIACVGLRANIPVMLVLVWINNPLTFVPICILSYKIGELLLGIPPSSLSSAAGDFAQSGFSSLTMQDFTDILLPLFVGAITAGVACGLSGYFLTHLLWKLAKPDSGPFESSHQTNV